MPNPSFEEYITCPDNTNWYITACANWVMPTIGTSDYFNECSTDFNVDGLKYSVPQNYIGWQEARTGQAYSGFSFGLYNDGSCICEYISVKLEVPLVKETFYELSFYVSLADSFSRPEPLLYCNQLGGYFSNQLPISNNWERIDHIPQMMSDPEIWLNDSTGWQLVKGMFIAEGGEEFLTIGNFAKYDELQSNYYYNGPLKDIVSYYYIEDVMLKEIDFEIPNVFTPNGDLINDVFDLTILSSNSELIILNRWGDEVYNSQSTHQPVWDGNYQGKPTYEGTYFYKLKIGSFNKTGFVQLIR